MENQRNEIHLEEGEKNTQTIQQAILDMHSQIGLEDQDQKNDER